MLVGADAGGAHGHRARVLLGIRHQVGQRLILGPGLHDEGAGVLDDARQRADRRGVEAQLAVHLHGQEAGRVQRRDGVAVGLGLRQRGIGDLARGAGAVHHRDLRAQFGLDEGGQRAQHDVGAAARRKGHDHLDRAVRRPVGPSRARHRQHGRRQCHGFQCSHVSSSLLRRQCRAHPPQPSAGISQPSRFSAASTQARSFVPASIAAICFASASCLAWVAASTASAAS